MQRQTFHPPLVALTALIAALIVGCATDPPDPSWDERQLARRAVERSTDVWFLDIGQGSCSFVSCPDGESALLVDCGTSAAGGTELATVIKWINKKTAEMTKVTTIVSHPDKDHMSMLGGPQSVAPESISTVYVGRSLSEYPAAFTNWAARTRTPPAEFGPAEFSASDARFACGAATIDLLTVNATQNADTGLAGDSKNADSAILRLAYKGNAVIFPGDAEGVTERSALDNARRHGLDLGARTLLVGSHHGARTKQSNSEVWLTAVQPRTLIFSARMASSYHHPQCDVVDRVAPFASPTEQAFDFACGEGSDSIATRTVSRQVLSTDRNGHVLARLTSGGYRVLCQKFTPACDELLAEDDMP